MHFKLVMIDNNRRGREICLKSGDTILGRTKGCKIRISAHEVSRKHCRLRVNGETVCVKDLGSANGTSVNGNQVTGEYLLQPADRINVGPVTFMLERHAGAAPIDTPTEEVLEVITAMTSDFPKRPAAPLTVPEPETVTFMDYPGTPQPSSTAASAAVTCLPFANLDEQAQPAPPAPTAAPSHVATTMRFAELDDDPQTPTAPAVIEVTATVVEECLPFADLDAEAPANHAIVQTETEQQIEWLLSDDKR